MGELISVATRFIGVLVVYFAAVVVILWTIHRIKEARRRGRYLSKGWLPGPPDEEGP